MPELPDVENFKQYIDATSLHHKISETEVHNTKILKGISKARLADTLNGTSLESCRRHGKYLLIKTSGDVWLVMHFGMTGSLNYAKQEKDLPEHSRLILNFENGSRLAYISMRLFGRIRVIGSMNAFIRQNKLGPDAADISLEDFEKTLHKSRAAVKTALMDQSRIAGLGNLYTDEILFEAHIPPNQKSQSLDAAQIKILYQKMEYVLKEATRRHAVPKNMPQTWLLPHRERNGRCPRCHNPFKTAKINGRTAYYCSSCQQE